MTTVDRIRVPWEGGRGGPGVSTFYALDASTALEPLHGFFDALKALIPAPISWSFYGEGDTVVVETGVLSGTWSATGQTAVVATGASTRMADAVGATVKWSTGSVLFGHRLVGRTFLVPGISDMFGDGTLNDTVVTQLRGYAEAMIDAVPGNFVIWSRPFAGTPSWTDVHGRSHPAKAAHDGAVAPISNASVPDKGMVLRSRRG